MKPRQLREKVRVILLKDLMVSSPLHCADVALTVHASGYALAPALFLAGLTGSAFHCAVMCGPLALSLRSGELASFMPRPESKTARVMAALTPAYHAGRIGAYAVIGGLAGELGATLRSLPAFDAISKCILCAAALLFVFSSTVTGGKRHAACASASKAPDASRASYAMRHARMALTGAGTALLPCGLLYGAAAAASASGSWRIGAVSMAAFGVGAVPALFAVSFLGAEAAGKWGARHAAFVRAAPLLSGAWLFWLAVRS